MQNTNKMKSKIGLRLAGVYILICVGLDFYALFCSEFACSLRTTTFTAIPWSFYPLNKSVFFLINDSFSLLIIVQLFTAFIIYFIGAGITKIINRFMTNNQN